jgi:hypothetical protein
MYIVNEVTCLNEPSSEIALYLFNMWRGLFFVGPAHTYGCFSLNCPSMRMLIISMEWVHVSWDSIGTFEIFICNVGFYNWFWFVFPSPRLVNPSSSKVERQIIHFATSMCLDHIPSNKCMYIYIHDNHALHQPSLLVSLEGSLKIFALI